GIGEASNRNNGFLPVSESNRKHALLMYYDKRFQLDPVFPLIAINHSQIRDSGTGGYLLTKKRNFPEIAKQIMNVDIEALTSMMQLLEKGEQINPSTPEEKLCFKVI
ncbi:hypothetical protein K488DRAFT_16196, partial [Vararia minispora EC-137]